MDKHNSLVTVCDHCLTASCWQGKFMCDNATFAGTVDLPLHTLDWLAIEHPSHWKNSHERPKSALKPDN